MKVKITLPEERIETAGVEDKPAVRRTYVEKEYEVENREQVRFTTDPEALHDSGVKVLVNPNHAALIRFED